MATTLLLIRHAAHDLLGNALAGRAEGVRLNARGRDEAQRLVRRLRDVELDAIFVSPRERARETAAPLALHSGISAQADASLDEIDFGEWTGRAFAALADDAQWKLWVERRSIARPPGGERFSAVQARIVSAITRIGEAHDGRTVALVSHGDVIKAGLAHYLAISLDHLERFEIAPASISVLVAARDWFQVKTVNDTGALLR
jgi:broad specificity phosphatase PhoE